jgi:hypothetical protein
MQNFSKLLVKSIVCPIIQVKSYGYYQQAFVFYISLSIFEVLLLLMFFLKMDNQEFVIVLTQHRFLGNIFLPYLIGKEDKFYTTIKLVRPNDIQNLDYNFRPYEKELVDLINKYSDERLMKRFSRAANVTEFYSGMETLTFQKQISPYLEQCMWNVARILMLSPVRLLNKEVKYANLYDEDEINVSPFFGKPVFHFERTRRLKHATG